MKNIKHYLMKYLIVILGFLLAFLLIFLIKLLSLPYIINVFLFLIIVIVVPITCLKISLDYDRYGDKLFKFNVKLNYNELELISKDIEKIETYQKIIVKDNRIIVINKSGIFEFILFNKSGVLSGNIKDEFWYYNEEKIFNPFVVKSEHKYNYFIINGVCLYKTDAFLVTKSNIYYELSKYLNKSVFDNDKINELYNTINNSLE